MPTKRCIWDLDHKSLYPKRHANPIIFLHILTKGIMLWFGEMTVCVEGMYACGYKHTIKIQTMYSCNYTTVSHIHCIPIYAVKYTYADLVKRQSCGQVQAMSDTCGASGNTSDTNTNHGLQEWVSVMPWLKAPEGECIKNPYTTKHCGISDRYSLARAGFCHWKSFWSNSGWLRTRRTTVLYVPNWTERGLPPQSCESSHHVNGGEATVWLHKTGWISRRPRGQSIRVHTRRCESKNIPMIQHDRRSHCAYVGLLLQLYSIWLYNVNVPFLYNEWNDSFFKWWENVLSCCPTERQKNATFWDNSVSEVDGNVSLTMLVPELYECERRFTRVWSLHSPLNRYVLQLFRCSTYNEHRRMAELFY